MSSECQVNVKWRTRPFGRRKRGTEGERVGGRPLRGWRCETKKEERIFKQIDLEMMKTESHLQCIEERGSKKSVTHLHVLTSVSMNPL